MKRYIRSPYYDEDGILDDLLSNITCIVVTDNAFKEDLFQYVRAAKGSIDYRNLTDEQISELSDEEIHSIEDVGALRRIPKDRLTLNQLRKVTKVNENEQVPLTISKVKVILKVLRSCNDIALQRFRPKNASFSKSLRSEGIVLRDSDVVNIIHNLHVKDFSHGKYSYEEDSWCHLWAVFEYKDDYSFVDKGGNTVVKKGFNVYIKIETQPDADGSVVLISFHDPQYKLSHPFENYPVNKE